MAILSDQNVVFVYTSEIQHVHAREIESVCICMFVCMYV